MYYLESGATKKIENIYDAFLTKTDYDDAYISGNTIFFGNEGFDCEVSVLNGEEILFGQPETFDGVLFTGRPETKNVVSEIDYALYDGYNLVDTEAINISSGRSAFYKNGYYDGMCVSNVLDDVCITGISSGISSKEGYVDVTIELNKNSYESLTFITPDNDIINGVAQSNSLNFVKAFLLKEDFDHIFEKYKSSASSIAVFPSYRYRPSFNPFYSVTNVIFIENYGFLTKDDFEESMDDGVTDAVSIINPTIIGETYGGFYSGNGINVNFSPFSAITNDGKFIFTYSPKIHEISGITSGSGIPFSTTYGYSENNIDVDYFTDIRQDDKEIRFNFDENNFMFDFPQFINLSGTVSTASTTYTISIDTKYTNINELKFYTDSGFTGLFYESGISEYIPYFNEYSKFNSDDKIVSAYTTMRIFNNSTESASTESLGKIRPLFINKGQWNYSYIDNEGNYKKDITPFGNIGIITALPKKKNVSEITFDNFNNSLNELTSGGSIVFTTAGTATINFNLGSGNTSNPNTTVDKIVAIKEIYDEKVIKGDKILKARIIKIYTGKDIIVNGH